MDQPDQLNQTVLEFLQDRAVRKVQVDLAGRCHQQAQFLRKTPVDLATLRGRADPVAQCHRLHRCYPSIRLVHWDRHCPADRLHRWVPQNQNFPENRLYPVDRLVRNFPQVLENLPDLQVPPTQMDLAARKDPEVLADPSHQANQKVPVVLRRPQVLQVQWIRRVQKDRRLQILRLDLDCPCLQLVREVRSALHFLEARMIRDHPEDHLVQGLLVVQSDLVVLASPDLRRVPLVRIVRQGQLVLDLRFRQQDLVGLDFLLVPELHWVPEVLVLLVAHYRLLNLPAQDHQCLQMDPEIRAVQEVLQALVVQQNLLVLVALAVRFRPADLEVRQFLMARVVPADLEILVHQQTTPVVRSDPLVHLVQDHLEVLVVRAAQRVLQSQTVLLVQVDQTVLVVLSCLGFRLDRKVRAAPTDQGLLVLH